MKCDIKKMALVTAITNTKKDSLNVWKSLSYPQYITKKQKTQ